MAAQLWNFSSHRGFTALDFVDTHGEAAAISPSIAVFLLIPVFHLTSILCTRVQQTHTSMT